METKEISLKALQEIPSQRGDKAWGSSNVQEENLGNLQKAIKSLKDKMTK